MTAATPFIQLRRLVKVLGGRPVLDGLDLEVRRGETLVIMGASGSGKSVTLRHIVGLMRPDSGRVVVDGEDVTELGEADLVHVRRKVGFIFQAGALFDSMTVGENVAFGLREHGTRSEEEIGERVAEALRQVGLEGLQEAMPEDLSGGMRKRVALARTMAVDPACLLYDEPTTGLDPVNGFRVSELIRETGRRSQVTSVVVTHDIPAAFFVADRIAFLHQGRIAFVGTAAEAAQASHPALSEFLSAYEVRS